MASEHERILEIFKQADLNEDGTLSTDEMIALFVDLGYSQAQARATFAAADADRNGKVEVEEFVAWALGVVETMGSKWYLKEKEPATDALDEVSEISPGFFLCGAHGLVDRNQLDGFGVKYILNVAGEDLYAKKLCAYKRGLESHEAMSLLSERLNGLEIKIIGSEDVKDEDLSVHFTEMADFIEAGRENGGIVVHCAMGVSRSATACLAYLMLKRGFPLETAFCIVHQARDKVRPNDGFWKQLRNLESELREAGALKPAQECAGFPFEEAKRRAASNFMMLADYRIR